MPNPKERKYTAEEFFELTPEGNNNLMELFKGKIVSQASPSVVHQRISMKISRVIDSYISSNNGKCEVFSAPFDVKLDEYTVVVPDISVICDPTKLSDGMRCNGAPDFIIEITSGNWKDDFIRKLALYQEHGVLEYWIVDPIKERVVVYLFEESNSPNIYTFEQDIPVGIYDGKLTICIADLLE